jgi:DNA primase
MEYIFLLSAIENVLGKGSKKSKDNYAFHCPFCNHRKPKLEINLKTDENGHNNFSCWVCQTRGTTIKSLLRQLSIPRDEAIEVLRYVPKDTQEYTQVETVVELPAEYQPLHTASTTSVVANQVRRYLSSRGMTDYDILKYQIGYCATGPFEGRIIIPSFTPTGKLNFFIGRDFTNSKPIKYKLPQASRDLIFFENLINWNQPVVLCEGTFDAMAVKRNAIPLLGKTLQKELEKKLVTSPLEDIYIALDTDAKDQAFRISEKLLNQGKRVFLLDLDKKDPSEIGFEEFTTFIQTAKELDLTQILLHKLDS